MGLNHRLQNYLKMTDLSLEEVAAEMDVSVYDMRQFMQYNDGLSAEHIEKMAKRWPVMAAYLFQTPVSVCFHNQDIPDIV